MIGMGADGVASLKARIERWIVTDVTAGRGQAAATLANKLAAEGVAAEIVANTVILSNDLFVGCYSPFYK